MFPIDVWHRTENGWVLKPTTLRDELCRMLMYEWADGMLRLCNVNMMVSTYPVLMSENAGEIDTC